MSLDYLLPAGLCPAGNNLKKFLLGDLLVHRSSTYSLSYRCCKGLLAPVVYLLRRLLRRKGQPSALLIPCAGPGSLGDDAMMRAAFEEIGTLGYSVSVLTIWPAEPWTEVVKDVVGARVVEVKFCRRRPLLPLALLTHFLTNDRLFMLGADVVDGKYSVQDSCERWNIASLASVSGCAATMLGFSWGGNLNPAVSRAATEADRANVRIMVRDPISYRRLQHINPHAATLVADMAFLLKRHQLACPSYLDEWISSNRKFNHVVGINICSLTVPASHGQAFRIFFDQMLDAYSLTAQYLLSIGAGLVLIPHDNRDHQGRPSDIDACRALIARLPAETARHVLMLPYIENAQVLKAQIERLDLVITGRMHLAIGASSMGIPAVSITYNDKFEGMYQHLGLHGMTPEPSLFEDGESLLRTTKACVDDLAGIRARLEQALPKVFDLARLNFHNN